MDHISQPILRNPRLVNPLARLLLQEFFKVFRLYLHTQVELRGILEKYALIGTFFLFCQVDYFEFEGLD